MKGADSLMGCPLVCKAPRWHAGPWHRQGWGSRGQKYGTPRGSPFTVAASQNSFQFSVGGSEKVVGRYCKTSPLCPNVGPSQSRLLKPAPPHR